MKVSPKEEAILKSIYTHYLLTVEQVTRLHYSAGSVRYVSALLKSMAEKNLLVRSARDHVSLPYVYMLGKQGMKYLREIREDIISFYPSEHKALSWSYIKHIIATNDVLIAALKLSPVAPNIEVIELKHDWLLRTELKNVVPDGWINFLLNGNMQVCVWLEVDRGTEKEKAFRRKIAVIVEFIRYHYVETFGTPSVTVAFATTQGQRRCEAMRVWTEKELSATFNREFADVFRFAAITTGALEPNEVFLATIWKAPFRDEHVALIGN